MKKYLKSQIKDNKDYGDQYEERYIDWGNATIDNLPDRYTIEVRKNGGVFETEIS